MSKNTCSAFSSFCEAADFIVSINGQNGPYNEKYEAACEYIALPEESARNLK